MINTQLWINNILMDLDKEIDVPLTYSIADIKQPEKRKRNSSKTIKLAGTRRNSSFFESAYDMHIADLGSGVGFDFDPTLRYPARAQRNGTEIFRGTAHLTEVTITGGARSFHVVLYSEIANLFQALGDLKMGELGWDSYDHTLNLTAITDSWSTADGSGYRYPYIDFGFGQDPLNIQTNQFYPYFHIKEMIEKCFAVSDLVIDSTWLNTTRVKKILWGYGGGELTNLSALEVADRRANYTGDGGQTYSLAVTDLVIFNLFRNWIKYFFFNSQGFSTITLVTDTYNQFSTGGFLSVFNNGNYRLSLVGTFPITYAFTGAVGVVYHDIKVRMEILKNGAVVAYQPITIIDTANGSATLNFNLQHDMDLDGSDVVVVRFIVDTFGSYTGLGGANAPYDIDIDFDNSFVYDFTALNVGLEDGDTVNVSRFIPDVKASDFLQDMILAFNLYMGDPDREGNVRLEPAGDFYFETDDTDDWTDKISYDKAHPISVKPASNIEGKTYEFHWTHDEDYYKSLYAQEYGQQYGDYDYLVPSTFKKGSKPYHMKVTAQSVPVQLEGTDIIIPRIVKLNDANLILQPHKGKPRIFFWLGLNAVTSTWNIVETDGTVNVQTNNPQVHHLDNLTSPTFDLNFGIPQWVYYVGTAYTTSNLWSENHAQFIRELTGRDSKILNAYFKLKESDFYEGFMRRLKNIDGVVYRVNIIKDYLANSDSLTKTELVKIVAGDSSATFITGLPVAKLPPLGFGGEPDTPARADFTATSNQNFYAVDTQTGDVVVTLDADELLAGWKGSFKKIASPNKIRLTPTGGGPGGTQIDGKNFLDIKVKDDGITIYFDGQNFYVI